MDLVGIVREEERRWHRRQDSGEDDGDSIRAFLRRSGGWFGGAVGIEADPENAAHFETRGLEQARTQVR